MFEFATEMYFDQKTSGNKSTTDKSSIRLFQTPAIMARSFKRKSSLKSKTQNLRESKTTWLSITPRELCERSKFLQQEIQAGKNSNLFNKEIVAIADKLLNYKSICTKQHRFLVN